MVDHKNLPICHGVHNTNNTKSGGVLYIQKNQIGVYMTITKKASDLAVGEWMGVISQGAIVMAEITKVTISDDIIIVTVKTVDQEWAIMLHKDHIVPVKLFIMPR